MSSTGSSQQEHITHPSLELARPPTMKNNPAISAYFLSIFTFLCMVLFLANHQREHFFHSRSQFDVRIINGFTNNSSLPLVIWCWTGKTDMGGRALQEGDDYSMSHETEHSWLMWAKGVETSNVFCTMKWDQRRKKFCAFEASRGCSPLGLCLWVVKEDGFYFSSDGVTYHKDFTWS